MLNKYNIGQKEETEGNEIKRAAPNRESQGKLSICVFLAVNNGCRAKAFTYQSGQRYARETQRVMDR